MTTPWNGWVLGEEIGRGGMGLVYLATHPEHQPAVIKTARRIQRQFRTSILREIRTLSAIDHPNVVSILDAGIEENVPWYAMEHLEGETLRDRMFVSGEKPNVAEDQTTEFGFSQIDVGVVPASATERTLPPFDSERFTQFATPLLAALETLADLHRLGVVHADLKPEHVVLREDGVTLVDFGLATGAPGVGGRSTVELRSPGAGTAHYMAPEQKSGQPIDARADVYAIGCILREFFTYDPTGRVDLDAVRDLPPDLSALIQQMLVVDPARRIAYVADVVESLSAIINLPTPPIHRDYLHSSTLVGRDQTLGEIDGELRRGHSAVVAGPFGVGKSRLLDELARQWSFEGRRVRVATISGSREDQLQQFVAAADKEGELTTPQLVRWLAEDGTLWVVDDAHQLHPDILVAIQSAVRESNTLFLFGARSDQNATSTLHPIATPFELQPLTATAVGEIARQVTGAFDPLEGSIVRELNDTSGGNAWVLIEQIRRRFLGDDLVNAVDIDGLVGEKVRQHGDPNAPEGTQRLLAAIALLEHVPQLERFGIDVSAAHVLVDAGLVLETDRGYRFSLPSISDHVRETLGDRLSEFADDVAVVLQSQSPCLERDAQIALVSHAADREDANQRLWDAAASAREQKQIDLERSLRLKIHERATDSERRVENAIALAETFGELSNSQRALAILEEIEALSAAHPSLHSRLLMLRARIAARDGRIALLESALAAARQHRGSVSDEAQCEIYDGVLAFRTQGAEGALVKFERAFELWSSENDPQGMGRSGQCVGMCLGRLGKLRESRTWLEGAVPHHRAAQDWDELKRTLISLSVLDVFEGFHRRAAERLEEALTHQHPDRSWPEQALLKTNLATSLWHIGERTRGRQFLEEALDLLIFCNNEVNQLLVLSTLAKTDVFYGDLDLARERLLRSEAIIARFETPYEWNEAQVAMSWTRLYVELDDHDAVFEYSKKAQDLVAQTANGSQMASCAISVALMYRQIGAIQDAHAHLISSRETILAAENDRSEALWEAEMALTCRAMGDHAAAKTHRDAALKIAGEREYLRAELTEDDYLEQLRVWV